MMMRALGYFQYTEDYDDGFVLATVRQGSDIGIFNGVGSDGYTSLPMTTAISLRVTGRSGPKPRSSPTMTSMVCKTSMASTLSFSSPAPQAVQKSPQAVRSTRCLPVLLFYIESSAFDGFSYHFHNFLTPCKGRDFSSLPITTAISARVTGRSGPKPRSSPTMTSTACKTSIASTLSPRVRGVTRRWQGRNVEKPRNFWIKRRKLFQKG